MTTPAADRPTVLIGEDSLVVRQVLRWHLEAEGFDVAEASDGAEAVEVAQRVNPSVVLLDVEMPTMNGHEALLALKAIPATADTPIVFITARAATDDMVEGLRLGAHDYLRKPFEPAELIARVNAAIRVKHLQDELKQRNAELDRMSRSDPLTGLANRRHITEQISAAEHAAARHGHPLSIVIVDVDHFKRVNDTYGHPAGDAVLIEVARRMVATARAEDTVGRWGGEEFLIVLPWADGSAAADVAERIRSAIGDYRIALDNGSKITVTVSVGCASGTDSAVVTRADKALYEAKEAGRNRIVMSTR